MPDPEELRAEIESNRDQLRTVIPARLMHQYQVILSSRECLEDWYAALLLKILDCILRVCNDLALTIEQENALPAAAWNARNLLELWIWSVYCSSSRKNALRFHGDTLRDVAGLVEASYKICKLAGIDSPFEESPQEVQELLDGLALKHLGIVSIDSNYQRVLQAAQSVRLGDEYAAWNKHLSKFAHPSAFVVIGVMSNGNFTRHFQSINTSVGVSFCHRCVTAFEKIVAEIPSTKLK
jgi:hypothetical protein